VAEAVSTVVLAAAADVGRFESKATSTAPVTILNTAVVVSSPIHEIGCLKVDWLVCLASIQPDHQL